MTLVVQKYGGSSLAGADKIKGVAHRIKRTLEQRGQVVAVVSAMGDTTDELIDLAQQVTSSPHPREMDLLLSTGELISATLMSMALREMGCNAISLTGAQAGIRTDETFGKARIASLNPGRIQRELDAGQVVIVAGFQGTTEDMDITTLGRGGSDTTAVALAAALRADRCEIYTDVEGIYTADPRVAPGARKLAEIGYDEMLELASYGAKMHPRSIELGAVYRVPILVASTFSEASGTLIHGDVSMEVRNKVRGVTYDLNVARITVQGVPDRPGIASSLFEPLADTGISVDVIVQNASEARLTDLSFTVARTDLERAMQVVRYSLGEVGARGVVSDDNLAKVSVVGTGMQNTPGYASRMFRTLYESGINIEMITTSEIRITCIVTQDQAREAAKALHDAFDLDNE